MRTVADMLGEPPGEMAGGAGVAIAALSPAAVGQTGQVNSAPLGSLTGAPPHARMVKYEIIPFTAVNNAREPTLVAGAMRQNRVVTMTAPSVGFSIYIGTSGVRPGVGIALPAGLPFDVIVPGGQEFYAVTDAPTYLPLQVLDAPLLVGDKERRG